jgi:hypothetical protein
VSLQTQPVGLTVKALPQPLPAEFTGAVGRYEWEVKADTNALSTDEALTIVVEVKGNGDTRRFGPPKIVAPSTCEIFEPRILEEEEYEGELEIIHRKRFEYVVLPKDTGLQEITPILSYFDVDSNRYCQLRAGTIQFRVKAGKNYRSPNTLTDTPPQPPNVAKQSGLLDHLLEWLRSPLLWSILALPLVVFGIVIFLRKRNPGVQKPINPPTSPQPQTSNPPTPDLASARIRMGNAGQLLKTGDPKRFYEALFKALQAWLSARLGLQPAQMNETDLSALLLQRGASPIRIQALLSVWHTCEQAIYGGQAQPEQMESAWQMAGQVLEALDREVR